MRSGRKFSATSVRVCRCVVGAARGARMGWGDSLPGCGWVWWVCGFVFLPSLPAPYSCPAAFPAPAAPIVSSLLILCAYALPSSTFLDGIRDPGTTGSV